MTLNQMQYFSTVCRCGSITTAAKVLMLSQPSLSSRLAELEKEVGVKLLERTAKGVYPTQQGKRLLSQIDAVLKRYQVLERDIASIVDTHEVVRVGFRPFSGESEMIQLCRDYREKFPLTRIVYNEMRNATPTLFLDENQFDFLATTERLMPQNWREKYDYCLLTEMEDVKLYCHILNPLSRLDEVGLADLDGCPIAFWDGHKEVLDRLRAAMDEHGYCLEHVAVMPQLSGIANLICNNAAVGVLNGDFVKQIDIIQPCTLKQELSPVFLNGRKIPVYLLWKKSAEKFEHLRRFAEFARSWSRRNAE